MQNYPASAKDEKEGFGKEKRKIGFLKLVQRSIQKIETIYILINEGMLAWLCL